MSRNCKDIIGWQMVTVIVGWILGFVMNTTVFDFAMMAIVFVATVQVDMMIDYHCEGSEQTLLSFIFSADFTIAIMNTNKEESIMFKKGFKFYMGIYAAAACVTGVILVLFHFGKAVHDTVVDRYSDLIDKIKDRLVVEKD